MFMRSNLRRAGLTYAGRTYEAEWLAAVEGDAITGVVAHAWNDVLLLQAPGGGAGELAVAAVAASGRPVKGLIGAWAQVLAVREALRLTARPSLDSREDL